MVEYRSSLLARQRRLVEVVDLVRGLIKLSALALIGLRLPMVSREEMLEEMLLRLVMRGLLMACL